MSMRLELATVERLGSHVNITLRTDHATAERLLRELCDKPTPAEIYEAHGYLSWLEGTEDDPSYPKPGSHSYEAAADVLKRAGVDPNGPRPFVLRISETPSGRAVKRYIPRNECVGSKSDGWEPYEVERRTPWSQRRRRSRQAA